MGAREPESCLQISGERRMALTIVVITADSSEATQDIITDIKEKMVDFIKKLGNSIEELFVPDQPCELQGGA